jgi:transposase
VFSPINGVHFLLELPTCNTEGFEIFLTEFSNQTPEELKVIILDNGAFHKAKKLKIPENIILIFLPPYSPELNPAEKIWAKFKRDFTNRLFENMETLKDYVCKLACNLTNTDVISITSFEYFFHNFWTKI